MIITLQSKLYTADGKRVVFPPGLKQSDYVKDGQTIQELRAGGYDWYLYQPPAGHDPTIHRLDGVIVLGSYTCTEGLIDLTPEELQTNIDVQNASIELQRSSRYRNESDPHFFYWQRGEGTEQEWLGLVAQIRAELPYI